MGEQKGVCEQVLFNKIFKAQSGDLYRFLYYKYGEDNNPDDLVQEAFLKLWKNCENVEPEKARSFLFTVASNQALNELSKKKTALKYIQNQDEKATNKESPDYILEETQYMDRLQAAIEGLTEDQRITFLLNRIEGKKHEEIAEMLGISRKAVEKRIYKALAILREKLGDIK